MLEHTPVRNVFRKATTHTNALGRESTYIGPLGQKFLKKKQKLDAVQAEQQQIAAEREVAKQRASETAKKSRKKKEVSVEN